MCRFLIVFLSYYLCLITPTISKEGLLDKSIERLASDLVREHPELAKDKRRSEARDEFIKTINGIANKKLHPESQKLLIRRKSVIAQDKWEELVHKYKHANIKGAQESFYLKQASEQKLPADRQFLLYQLLDHYYTHTHEARILENQTRMRLIGKAFTAYLSKNKKTPDTLSEIVTDPKLSKGIDPATGQEFHWIYTAAKNYDMRGTNRKRVILAANIPTGRNGELRWVAYKGGTYGTWKTSTLEKALAKMDLAFAKTSKKTKSTNTSKKAPKTKKKVTRSKKLKR